MAGCGGRKRKGAHPVLAYFRPEQLAMTGDAVPGPLAFVALSQKHDMRKRRCRRDDGIAHATGLLWRSGCLPAAPLRQAQGRLYPPQQQVQAISRTCRGQVAKELKRIKGFCVATPTQKLGWTPSWWRFGALVGRSATRYRVSRMRHDLQGEESRRHLEQWMANGGEIQG